MKNLAVKLDKALHQSLRIRAIEEEKSLREVVEAALRDYLRKERKAS